MAEPAWPRFTLRQFFMAITVITVYVWGYFRLCDIERYNSQLHWLTHDPSAVIQFTSIDDNENGYVVFGYEKRPLYFIVYQLQERRATETDVVWQAIPLPEMKYDGQMYRTQVHWKRYPAENRLVVNGKSVPMVFDESVRSEPNFGMPSHSIGGGSPDDRWLLYTSAGDKNGGGISFGRQQHGFLETNLIYFAVDIVDEEHLPKEPVITIK